MLAIRLQGWRRGAASGRAQQHAAAAAGGAAAGGRRGGLRRAPWVQPRWIYNDVARLYAIKRRLAALTPGPGCAAMSDDLSRCRGATLAALNGVILRWCEGAPTDHPGGLSGAGRRSCAALVPLVRRTVHPSCRRRASQCGAALSGHADTTDASRPSPPLLHQRDQSALVYTHTQLRFAQAGVKAQRAPLHDWVKG